MLQVKVVVELCVAHCDVASRQGYRPTTLPKELKTNGGVEVSTWGGPVVRQRAQRGGSEYEYHMFASTFVNGCNVWEWMSNSIITHAVSKSPLGPYEQRETIPTFHELFDCHS